MSDQVGTPNPTDEARAKWDRFPFGHANRVFLQHLGNFAVWEGQVYAIERVEELFESHGGTIEVHDVGEPLFRLVLPSSSEPEGE